jgi:hypothetical protein
MLSDRRPYLRLKEWEKGSGMGNTELNGWMIKATAESDEKPAKKKKGASQRFQKRN